MAFAMRPVGLLVVAILVIADAASGRRLQEPVTRCESCRLRLDVATDKVTYEVGEPIVISIRLTNVGSSPVDVQERSAATRAALRSTCCAEPRSPNAATD